MRAIELHEWGGTEVLQLRDIPIPEPRHGEVLIRVSTAGMNFADTQARRNLYLVRYELPFVPGMEVAGVVERDGGGFTAGQRVAALCQTGGYAEFVVVPAPVVVPIPDGVSDAQALAVMLQGLTAWHLYHTVARATGGESVVVVAAAGGVGSLAVQLGKSIRAKRVIGLASTEEKRSLALDLGADAALDHRRDDLVEAIIDANDGNRVDLVFEMAGGRLFDQLMKTLAPLGRMVTYGVATREVNQVPTGTLIGRSHSIQGFWLIHTLAYPELVGPPIAELFERVLSGDLRVIESETYPLSNVRRAHEDVEAGRTAGKVLLDPAA
jgi:NADPH:quinone reductase